MLIAWLLCIKTDSLVLYKLVCHLQMSLIIIFSGYGLKFLFYFTEYVNSEFLVWPYEVVGNNLFYQKFLNSNACRNSMQLKQPNTWRNSYILNQDASLSDENDLNIFYVFLFVKWKKVTVFSRILVCNPQRSLRDSASVKKPIKVMVCGRVPGSVLKHASEPE